MCLFHQKEKGGLVGLNSRKKTPKRHRPVNYGATVSLINFGVDFATEADPRH